MARDGRVAELRQLAQAGDAQAARFFTWRLARDGHIDELRELAAQGDPAAGWALANWLLLRRRSAEAVEVMRPVAASGSRGAQRRLARLLAGLGRHVEAMAELAKSPPHVDDLRRVEGWLGSRGLTDRSGRPLQRYVEGRPSHLELAWVVLLLWYDLPYSAAALLRLIGPDEWLQDRLLGMLQGADRARAADLLAGVEPYEQALGTRRYLTGVAWSPDGRTVAAVEGSSGTIRLRDVATGSPGHVLRTGGTWTCGATFSPDGTVLACAGERVRLWDTRTGAVLRDLAGGISWAVAFSPDGTLLAGDGLWQVDTGERVADLPTPLAAAFSADGRRLAVAGETADHEPRLQVQHVATGRVLADQHSSHSLEAVGSVAFSPDGALLAVSIPRQRVFLWQVAGSLTFLRELHHVGGTAPLAFQPGGALLATGGHDRRARLFDVATGAPVRTIDTPTDHLAFSPDGTRLAIADAAAATVTLWEV